MVGAVLLGAVVGMERESVGQPAGLRTHMLVAVGSTLFVLACVDAGMSANEVSRVIQGLTAGIGFLGAGAILKLNQEREVKGLTTAAGIWMTAAAGVAVGLGRYGAAAIGIVLAWIILAVIKEAERGFEQSQKKGKAPPREP
jgi:putative Mg2+ transporter-C (MgtC) family protein